MENSIIDKIADRLQGSVLQESEHTNVGSSERIVSIGAGAFIALSGISNLFSHPLLAVTELGVGGGLLYRGLTGYCAVKERFEQKEYAPSYTSPTVPVSAEPTEVY